MNKTRQKHEIAYMRQFATRELPVEFVIVAGGLNNIGPDSSSTATQVTPTCEILDVGEIALQTYMEHLPASAVNTRLDPETRLEVFGGIQSTETASVHLAKSSLVTLEIIAYDGKVVDSYRSLTESRTVLVPLDGLKNGAYIARVTSAAGEVATTKFIVRN
jgi:hypothetical protein